MDNDNNKNMLLAVVLSFLVIVGWTIFFPPPSPPEEPVPTATASGESLLPPGTVPAVPGATPTEATTPLPEAVRLDIETPRVQGSISLRGGRIDDLLLRDYRETTDPQSPIVKLLAPEGQNAAFYAQFGWVPVEGGSITQDDLPGRQTDWTLVQGETLAPGKPITLEWSNAKGLVFQREISIDADYMFEVTDRVRNTGAGDVALAPYGQIVRHGLPPGLKRFFILHEGAISRVDGTLTETTYSDMTDLPQDLREGAPVEMKSGEKDGWIGFTDHYWMAILIPEASRAFTAVTKYIPTENKYQTEIRQPQMLVGAGQEVSTSTRLFAGAKEWEVIRDYENQPGFFARLFGDEVNPDLVPVPGFVDSIDWGWFYFFTKPIFAMLHWLHGVIGNMGLAIIALTVVLKVLVLPLAYKSYVSMARMKELQPEMEALKERAGDDRQKLQKEMMQLYRDKKVNPAAGCLPILIQIPIFFSLYKVIFVTLELRHAPFFGWLNDLSAPDPSSLFNLFGLLPYAAPETGTILHMVFIGVLPILLGITMWLQQKLNPAPTDPVQASIFAWMPWIFMFMLGGFASGLVVYWIANNVITFIQQYTIMRSHGHTPDIFGNIRSGFKKKPKAVANANSAPKASGPAKGSTKKK